MSLIEKKLLESKSLVEIAKQSSDYHEVDLIVYRLRELRSSLYGRDVYTVNQSVADAAFKISEYMNLTRNIRDSIRKQEILRRKKEAEKIDKKAVKKLLSANI